MTWRELEVSAWVGMGEKRSLLRSSEGTYPQFANRFSTGLKGGGYAIVRKTPSYIERNFCGNVFNITFGLLEMAFL